MTDATTRQPLRVIDDGTTGPYFKLPMSQLDDVCRLLDSHGIHYWVNEHAISFDGGPERTLINFSRRADAVAIQNILDRVD